MNRDARVSTKIMMHILIPSLYFTNVTRDRACVVYALMFGTDINFGVVLKSSMQKAQVHRGHRYSFRDLITTFCRHAGVLEEPLDNRPNIYAMPYSVTNIKGSNISFSSALTSQQRAHRDDLIMGYVWTWDTLPLDWKVTLDWCWALSNGAPIPPKQPCEGSDRDRPWDSLSWWMMSPLIWSIPERQQISSLSRSLRMSHHYIFMEHLHYLHLR